MATEIQIPKLGLTMTEGTIIEWVAGEGEEVAAGAVVMMIETDKVEAEVEAPASGIVHHTRAVGETLEPGEQAGWVLGPGESPPAGSTPPPAPAPAGEVEAETEVPEATPMPVTSDGQGAPAGRVVASPNAKRVARDHGIDLALVTGTGPGGRITSEDVEAAVPPGRGLGGRVLASPNARRVARERGVEVAAVTGTGPGGRVTSEDVEAYLAAAPAPSAAPAAPSAAPEPAAPAPAMAGSGRFVPFAAHKAAERLGVHIDDVTGTGPDGRVSREDVYAHARRTGVAGPAPDRLTTHDGPRPGDRMPFRGMRGVIAQRMHASLQEMAQLTLAMDVDMDRAVELREQLKELGPDEVGRVPGYTDFVIAAVARALRAHPMLNARAEGDHIEVLEPVNVGMAVAVPDGLVVPVIRDADRLGLIDLAGETAALAAAARDKTLGLEQMEGGTFSVTALGMYGVDMFTPVINPPNAAIMGIGRIRDDVAWEGGVATRAQRMTLSLTWDHRLVDGAPAAEFTQTVKALLEQPLRLLG